MRSPKQSNFLHLLVKQGKNKGFVVEHHFAPSLSAFKPPEQHVFGKGQGAQMLGHVAKTLGLQLPSLSQAPADD